MINDTDTRGLCGSKSLHPTQNRNVPESDVHTLVKTDLSNFDEDQTVMTRLLGQSFSQTAGLVGLVDWCSWYAVVSTYQRARGSWVSKAY